MTSWDVWERLGTSTVNIVRQIVSTGGELVSESLRRALEDLRLRALELVRTAAREGTPISSRVFLVNAPQIINFRLQPAAGERLAIGLATRTG
jgi:hypothetical protein